MSTRPLRLVVAGQGYVGLPLAMRAVTVGHDVTGLEVSTDRIKRLLAGESFVEDIPSSEIQAALDCGRYRVTNSPQDCAGFDVAVITVPTPLEEGAPDLSFIESAAHMLAPQLRAGSLVVLESTTYPGTTESLLVPILNAGSGLTAGRDFSVGYSPERIDPGNKQWTLQTTPKVISGIDEKSLAHIDDFYRTIVDQTVPVSSPKSAELAKLLENTFRHVNIALVNELAMFAADLQIDVWEAIDAASTKPFGFMRFTPGPGVGGHCLPIDPSYLSWTVRQRLGRSFRFVELANDINDHMPDYIASRVSHALNRQGLALSRSRVLVLGLAYKRNSSDARESPAAALVAFLLREGADVSVADPHVVEQDLISPQVRRVALSESEVKRADLVVLVTDHEAFDYELIAAHASCVLDTRHRMEGSHVEQL